MLLDIKFGVEVTNDGKNNNIKYDINKDVKVVELLTVLEMMKNGIQQSINKHFDNKFLENKTEMTESEFEEYFSKLTMEKLMNNEK